MSLKSNLSRLMKEKGLLIQDLANITKISVPTLKRLRSSEETNPTLDVLLRIASALDISLDSLIKRDDTMPCIRQGELPDFSSDVTEFILIFTHTTFSLLQGTRAIFKRYSPEDQITRFILTRSGEVFEKLDAARGLFQNESHVNFSIDKDQIFAVIIKEIYEVNYV